MDAITLMSQLRVGDTSARSGFPGTGVGGAGYPSELVRLSGVHKFYGRGLSSVHALHDINFALDSGDMIAICGPSGSGKTSLLNLISMLEPVSEGSVIITRLLISELSEQGRANLRGDTMGLVFQAFSLIPVMTVRENVLLPLILRGQLDRAALVAARGRADELLSLLGLATQANHYPARLDPSQSQRVAIARSLIGQPRFVLADEPTSRLDSAGTRQVMDLFAYQQQEHGTAFVITTRDQRQLSRVTRTLQLTEGRLLTTPAAHTRKPLRVHL